MSDTATEQKPRSRGTKTGPSAELAKRRRERKNRGVVDHGFDKRLSLNESELDHKNYRYRWVKDSPGRVQRLEAREWELVSSEDVGGQEVLRRMGAGEDGKRLDGHLMRKYKPWFDEDVQERQNFHRQTMQEMMRGKSAEQVDAGGEAPGYADKSNKVEDGTTTRKRRTNPDFE